MRTACLTLLLLAVLSACLAQAGGCGAEPQAAACLRADPHRQAVPRERASEVWACLPGTHRQERETWEADEMADVVHRWISRNGDFGDPESWHDNVVPVSDGLTVALFDGSSQADAKLSLDRGTGVLKVATQRAYKGKIGAAGNPLRFGSSVTQLSTFRGSGEVHVDMEGSGTLVVDSASRSGFFISGSLSRLAVKSGMCVVNGDGEVTSYLYMDGPATVKFMAAAGAQRLPTTMMIAEGEVESFRPVTTSSGKVSVGERGRWVHHHDTHGTFFLLNHGTFRLIGPYVLNGVVFSSGLLDLSKSPAVPIATINIGPKGRFFGESLGEAFFDLSTALDLREDYP
ncbi:MAG: hypothetical protein U0990_09435 [Candidatus Nanopelagicales bacterium]|nr:hypothetical protein [Candidatus Nanopelagicales bacterium]